MMPQRDNFCVKMKVVGWINLYPTNPNYRFYDDERFFCFPRAHRAPFGFGWSMKLYLEILAKRY
jgi:hypothetical protein